MYIYSMARKRTCSVCDGDHFKQVTVTLPSGKVRDTDFVYCCRCLLMFFRKPERDVSPPPILSIDLLRTLSAVAVSDAMRKLPDPNSAKSETVTIEHAVSYHGRVRIEFERATADDANVRYWRAKSASKAP